MNVHDYAEQVRANELFDLFSPQVFLTMRK